MHGGGDQKLVTSCDEDGMTCPSAKKVCVARPNQPAVRVTEVEDYPFYAHVEVCLAKGTAKSALEDKLAALSEGLQICKIVRNWKSFRLESDDFLSDIVTSVTLGCLRTDDGSNVTTKLSSLSLSKDNVHIYRLNEDGALAQDISLDVNSDDSTVGSVLWTLPCIEFESVWENLVYDSNLKNELMSYVYSLVQLSNRGANMKIINVNRLILLLGPPGTGKTSLCRGLAQHLAIRLDNIYPRSVMVEINSHSLFSKWFSESGKLVQKMFDQIDELAEDKKCMVFVLIDEVESLGMSRDTSSTRGDPADSIRAVNALLTQIDRVRRRENVLLLCTSNLEKCLDRALLDRADLVRHVGQPSQIALFSILAGCIQELQRIGIISDSTFLAAPLQDSFGNKESCSLWAAAGDAIGISGRSIRQIPALACSFANSDVFSTSEAVSLFSRAIAEKKLRSDCDNLTPIVNA